MPGSSGESPILLHCPGSPTYVSVRRSRIRSSAACRHRESSRRLSRWRCSRAQCVLSPNISQQCAYRLLGGPAYKNLYIGKTARPSKFIRLKEGVLRLSAKKKRNTKSKKKKKRNLHQPGIEPGANGWQPFILPLNHWCLILN